MTDIAELFARDPLSLTREDRTAIVQKMREDRAKFIANPKGARKEKEPKPEINLDDLEL